MIDIFVPTYGKADLPILQMLKDPLIRINLCIRSDCDKSIYDEVRKLDRVNFIELGYGINNLGQTRQRIVSYCLEHDIRYCAMFDDGLTDVKLNDVSCISDAIYMAILRLKSFNEDYPTCCYCFSRKGDNFLGVDKSDKCFSGLPLQAVVLDCQILSKYGVNYEDMDICGLEDVAFFMDAVKEGLVFIGFQDYYVVGKLPNVIVKGGSHTDESIEQFIKRRDRDHKRLMDYVGPTYGIMLTKKWRESLGFSLTYARIDFGYFREVLVNHRLENADLIKNKFRID